MKVEGICFSSAPILKRFGVLSSPKAIFHLHWPLRILLSICKLVFQGIIYHLWLERNSRLHNNSSKPYQVTVKEIQVILRAKLAGIDSGNSSSRQVSATPPPTNAVFDTYLSAWFEYFQHH